MTLTELTQRQALTVFIAADGNGATLTLRGEADAFTLPVLLDALSHAIGDTDGTVVVDLAGSDFIDGASVRAIGRAWRFLDDRDRVLTVRAPSAVAVRLLTLFGLSHVVEPARSAAA